MLSLLVFTTLSAAQAEVPASSEVTDYSAEWREVLAARREANIERLAAYASEGRYPLNLGAPGLSHQFMDDAGSRCGMAELIWQSGHESLVVDTYVTRNEAVIAELGLGDPLTDWVSISGLTMAEVAFIQEPGFAIGLPEEVWEEPLIARVDPELLELEVTRRSAHFAMAANQLRLATPASLDRAVLALGERVLAPPPALAWSSTLPHMTALPAAADRGQAARRPGRRG